MFRSNMIFCNCMILHLSVPQPSKMQDVDRYRMGIWLAKVNEISVAEESRLQLELVFINSKLNTNF